MQLRTRCAFVVAALVVGCGTESERDRPQPTVAEHMQNHFTHVLEVRDAVVLGRLDDTRRPATWLAEHGAPPDVPQGWIPYITDVRKAAEVVQHADDLAGVARATGDLSTACGRCHEALGAKVTFAYDDPPSDEPGAAARMLRHDWAVDRLWEGVVVPSDKAWTDGAEVLSGAPLAPTDATGDGPIAPEIADLANAVHDLGARAAAETDHTARGALFGELLETCVTCHQLAKVPRAHAKVTE